MKDGYAFEFTGNADKWKTAPSDAWDVEVYTATGNENLIGNRRIDGITMRVYKCPDGKLRAQLPC